MDKRTQYLDMLTQGLKHGPMYEIVDTMRASMVPVMSSALLMRSLERINFRRHLKGMPHTTRSMIMGDIRDAQLNFSYLGHPPTVAKQESVKKDIMALSAIVAKYDPTRNIEVAKKEFAHILMSI